MTERLGAFKLKISDGEGGSLTFTQYTHSVHVTLRDAHGECLIEEADEAVLIAFLQRKDP